MSDLLIKNGLVIDGSGSVGFYAAVLITGDAVTIHRGDVSHLEAERVIDATGYAAEAVFMPYAGRLADQSGGWTHFMWLLLVIACVGLVSTAMFLYRDHRAHQGPGNTLAL